MLASTDPTIQLLIDNIDGANSLDERSAAVKNLKNYVEAKNLLESTPIPELEPTGFRGFLHRNAGDLIKAGSTITIVCLIAGLEAKGDLIFRSKASKFI